MRFLIVVAACSWSASCKQLGENDTPATEMPSADTPRDTSATLPQHSVVQHVPQQATPPLDTAAFIPGDGDLTAELIIPVQGVVFADLVDTYTEARGTRVHEAIDILAPRGTPVLSAVDGTLLKLFNSKAGGLMVYATDLTERYILLYGHLDGYAEGLTNGMQLKRGQVIGYVGTTGNAPPGTPHLHFGILRGQPRVSWSAGEAVNPYPLFVPIKLPQY